MSDLTEIVSELQRRKGSWRQIARESGVPYMTLSKIARGTVTNPRVQTVEKLSSHLADQTEPAPAAD